MPPYTATDNYRVTHERGGTHEPVDSPMRLLANGIPLTLLLDLMSPHGPDSVRIAESERAPWA